MNYDILYSGRKTLCIQITEKAELLVRAPYGCPKKIIEEFVAAKEPWIQKKIAGRRAELKKKAVPPYSPKEKQHLIGLPFGNRKPAGEAAVQKAA